VTKILKAKLSRCRRLGADVFGTAKNPVHKRNYPKGQHGSAGFARTSDYAKQLRFKQMLRLFYGNIRERQFRTIFKKAFKRKGDTIDNFIGLLESRLDAFVLRAKFASTIFAAKQLISHGHILVNGRRVNIKSYVLRPGDVVEVRQKSKQILPVLTAISEQGSVPDYIEADHAKMTAKFLRVPEFQEVSYGCEMEPQLVVEFYSR
jgi:small subunit ribosomal protein S4